MSNVHPIANPARDWLSDLYEKIASGSMSGKDTMK